MKQVSLIASAVRPALFRSFLDSLRWASVGVEVVFVGNNPMAHVEDEWKFPENVHFKYIKTGNIKPAQCYEIARRNATGEVIVWVADDCEFPGDVLGKAYRYWKDKGNEKLILSLQTKESGYRLPEGAFFPMRNHAFFGHNPNTPLMAPLGMISRKFLDELGGFDRRYICGQYENDVVMSAYSAGGSVEIFGGPDAYVDIDHMGKSLKIGESAQREDFLDRPFAKGYPNDRAVLERSWSLSGVVCLQRNDAFEPFEDADILVKSQSNNLPRWE